MASPRTPATSAFPRRRKTLGMMRHGASGGQRTLGKMRIVTSSQCPWTDLKVVTLFLLDKTILDLPAEQLALLPAMDIMLKLLQEVVFVDCMGADRPAKRMLLAMRPKRLQRWMMSVADSFIMDVLRGWRLLQAAGLNAEEKRDTLSTTKNSLDYTVISAALQSLWNDQLLGRGHLGSSTAYVAHHMDHFWEDQLYYQDMDDWNWQDGGSWHDGYFGDFYDQESWMDDDWTEPFQASALEPEDPERKPRKQLSPIAREASRTWTEAQRAKQALRLWRSGFWIQWGQVLQLWRVPLCP